MQNYVVSLTSTPPRMAGMIATLESLRRQSVKPDEITVYIPRTYRRPEFSGFTVPKLPPWCRLVMVDEDFGPATKILHAVQESGTSPILYGDDDRIYTPDLAEELLRASRDNGGCCAAAVALPVSHYLMQYTFRKDWRYRLRRVLSLGRYKPTRVPEGVKRDIALGFGGVLVPRHAFPKTVFDIPDPLWLVDDIWLSGQMTINRVDIVSADPHVARSRANRDNERGALNVYRHGNLDRQALDRLCIAYFQKNHRLWRNTGGW